MLFQKISGNESEARKRMYKIEKTDLHVYLYLKTKTMCDIIFSIVVPMTFLETAIVHQSY
jgi:hypothetical protein